MPAPGTGCWKPPTGSWDVPETSGEFWQAHPVPSGRLGSHGHRRPAPGAPPVSLTSRRATSQQWPLHVLVILPGSISSVAARLLMTPHLNPARTAQDRQIGIPQTLLQPRCCFGRFSMMRGLLVRIR
jgi:hypothetical protein